MNRSRTTQVRMRWKANSPKKMDGKSVCAPLLAEPDALSLTTSTPHAASVTDADKVININIDSNQVEGEFCPEHAKKFNRTASSLPRRR